MRRAQYAIILPLAGGMTLLLAMMMKAVISTEFVPQPTDRDEATVATYIYESAIICESETDWRGLINVRFPLLLPPYTKTVSHPYFENPHDNRQTYAALKPKHLQTKPDIDIGEVFAGALSCNWNHGVRIPPQFPSEFLQGNTSGFCRISYGFSAEGQANDVEIINCTHEDLAETTRQAVRKWRRPPANCSEENARGGRQLSTIRYDLVDEDGELLPYP